MLIQIFKSVLLMSAVGSALGVFWLCLKPVTRRLFSPKWQYYIWLTVLLVMILPVSFSLPQRTPDIQPIAQVQNVAADTETVTAENQTAAVIPQELPETRRIPNINLPQNIMLYLSIVWCLGVIAVLLIKTVKYLMFLRTIHNNSSEDNTLPDIPKRLRVRRTQMLDAPLIIGLIKPVLYLPDIELSESNLNYILMHELTHYSRHDLLYKWFTMLVQSVHWFNPLIYAVSKQIDLDCEVSCDFAVTSKLTEDEQKSYMNMILDMLSNSRSNLRPLTTQMASNKKILERRFTMIKYKKTTSKFISVISVITAVLMLSATVFASGVMSGLTEDNYTVEITNNGEKFELANKPFIENGEVYLPLRETLEKVGITEHLDSYIQWNDGKIELCIAYDEDSAEVIDAHKTLNDGQGVDTVTFIFNYAIEIGKSTLIENSEPNVIGQDVSTTKAMDNAPVLKGSVTYIPYSYISSILDTQKWEINYTIYDKNEDLINTPETSPESVARQFLKNIERNHCEKAVAYCTDDYIDRGYDAERNYFNATAFGMDLIRVNSIEKVETDNDTTEEFLFS